MRQTQRGFGGDFVVDPAMAGRRPRIGLGALEVAGLQNLLTEEDVSPQVGVNGVVGETKNREAKDAEDERAAQHGIDWRRWHGGKITAAGDKKSFFVRQRNAPRREVRRGGKGSAASGSFAPLKTLPG